jgi:hypothetical protein
MGQINNILGVQKFGDVQLEHFSIFFVFCKERLASSIVSMCLSQKHVLT